MKSKRIVLIMLISALSSYLFGQNYDSLEAVFPKGISVLEKADDCLNRSDSLRRINPELSFQYAKLALRLNHKNDSIDARAHIAISNYHIRKGRYDEAIASVEQSMDIYQERNDSVSIAKASMQLGVIGYYKSDFTYAIKHTLSAARVLESQMDTISLASVYNNLGTFYQARDNEYEKAIDFFTKAYYQKMRNGDTLSANRTLGNIGSALTAIDKVDSGIAILKKTLPIKEKMGDLTGVAITKSNIGTGFTEIHEYDSAIKYLREAIAIDQQLGDSTGLKYEYFWLAKALYGNNQLKEAERMIADALSIPQDLVTSSELHLLKSQIYEQRNEYREALTSFKTFKARSDSLYTEQKEKTIQELQTKYETEKKEKEIASLAHKNELSEANLAKKKQLQTLLLILLLVIVIASIVVFYIQRQKSQLKETALQSEISQLRAEIQTQVIIQNQSFDRPLQELNEELVNPLSDREYDILQSIFTDKTNREIAEDLFISVNTVKYHLKNLYVKLGVSDRREALLKLT